MFLSVFFDIALLISFAVYQLLISAAKVLIFIHICNLRHSIFLSLDSQVKIYVKIKHYEPLVCFPLKRIFTE